MAADAEPRLTFVDATPAVASTLAHAVAAEGLDDVDVVCAPIHDLDVDAVVAPTNSFGLMDGGLDLAHVLHFGDHVRRHLTSTIAQRFDGELLVGQAVVVPTGKVPQRFLVAAPTMRVPMRLSPDTVNPYLAMRAILLAVAGHDDGAPIRTVAVPGLGTGTGRVPPAVAARQMVAAVRDVRAPAGPRHDWDRAIVQHVLLTSRQTSRRASTFRTER